jgi:hypothetical protein
MRPLKTGKPEMSIGEVVDYPGASFSRVQAQLQHWAGWQHCP